MFASLFNRNALGQFIFTALVTCLPILGWYIIGTQMFEDFRPSMVEIYGTWLTLICVWLTGKQNMWCWPTGIVSVLLFAYAFYEYQLYASAILNAGYYFLVQFWGWYQWEKGRPVEWSQTWTQRLGIILGIIGFTTAWGYFTSYTDAQYIVVDCAIMGISIVAQWLLNYKRPEAWLLFITVNVLSSWLYFTTGLYMIGALYTAFIGIAAYGCWQWVKSIRQTTVYVDIESIPPAMVVSDEYGNETYTHLANVTKGVPYV
jgi:nicotinamide mononucleotide transporter